MCDAGVSSLVIHSVIQIMHFIMYSGVFNTFVSDQYSMLIGGYGFLKIKCLTAIFHTLAQTEI